jgi:hypothetical protein
MSTTFRNWLVHQTMHFDVALYLKVPPRALVILEQEVDGAQIWVRVPKSQGQDWVCCARIQARPDAAQLPDVE